MMKPYTSKLLILICAVVCLNACKEKTDTATIQAGTATTKSKEINTNVVLKVGSEQFTAFELDKHFKMFIQKFLQTNHRKPTDDEIKTWVKEFTERAYVLADAKTKGYYDRKDIKDEVESVATLMLTQPHGLLEKKLEEKVTTPGGTPADAQKAKMAAVSDYQIKISKSAAVNIDKPAVTWLQNIFNKDAQKNTVKKDALGNNLGKTLATYQAPDGKPAAISVEQFMNFYNSLPLRRLLDDTSKTIGYLHQIAVNPYLAIDAEKMGLTKDPEFVLNKKNYTDNVVYGKYIQDNLGADRGVTDNDILAVYETVKQRMQHPVNIVYSVYTFSNQANAFKALGQLRMKPNDTTLNLNSLSVTRHIKYDKNSSQLPDTLKKMIYRAAPGQPMPPIPTDGYFTILMVESASGKEPYKPQEIKPYLTTLAQERRELAYNSKKAAELKNTFKIENNIDVKAFINNQPLTAYNSR